MKKNMLLLVMVLLPLFIFSQDIIRVMTYNVLNFPNVASTETALRAGYFRQIVESEGADIIIIQELNSASAANILLNELNTNTALGKTYSRSPMYTGYGSNQQGNMLFYNEAVVDLVGTTEIAPSNVTDPDGLLSPRGSTRYSLIIQDLTCFVNKTPLEVISTHLKASPGTENEERRLVGVLDILDDLATLPANTNVILGGDFNFYSMSDMAYVELLDNTNDDVFFDPLGGWTAGIAGDLVKYTQSTTMLDDRFDFWFLNDAVNGGANDVTMVAGSYRTVGTDGVGLDQMATQGTSPLATELEMMSDHYPVVMDLEVSYPNAVCPSCQAWNGTNTISINN